MTQTSAFDVPIAERVWSEKYRFGGEGPLPPDRSFADTVDRVGRAIAGIERGRAAKALWAERYRTAIEDLGFLPGGRILAGAGTGREVTLFNCFVMGRIEDDLGAIFDNLKEAALTMQQGGGIGHDFSTLRPAGAPVRSIGADASGPVSFMDVWDAMCRTIKSAGARRGAMMATLACDHPDIEAFVEAKRDPARLRNFNLSVLVTDAFMAAVEEGRPWDLRFDGQVVRTVEARALWDRIMRATYDVAEPGVVFIDRINARNNLAYCEEIRATNPCGEQPLPPHGACLLGSLNLARLVARPFEADAAIDLDTLEARVGVAVRFLDAAIDVSRYPLAAQKAEARAKRRIGLGVTGLADALILCGARYGDEHGLALAETWMAAIQRAAYRASARLAAEKGAFPLFDRDAFLAAPNVVALDAETRDLVARHGIRNGCLTSIAPTGTISLLAGNVSSGIEPVFDLRYTRRVLEPDGSRRDMVVEDYAHRLHRQRLGAKARLGAAFVTAAELTPQEHLAMQAAIQRHVDSAISKTINCPQTISFQDFQSVYRDAYRLGLKGCTTFRLNPVTGAVLLAATTESEPPASAEPEEGVAPPAAASAARPPPAAAAPPVVHPRVTTLPADARSGGVVYMAQPLERDPALAGYTYKLKWPGNDHAIYVTLNDIERDGRRRPFEIFINTKNLEHYAWTVALTRMISAVFRRGGDVSFVVEELKAVFDPQGGRWMQGRYVPSLLAAIGEVIETHLVRIGFLQPDGAVEPIERSGDPVDPRGALTGAPHGHGARPARRIEPSTEAEMAPARVCARCLSPRFVREEGCWICRDCGYSRCG